MRLKDFIRNLAFGVSVMASIETYGQKIKPNVVFLLADDMGWADLPVYGNKFNEAPQLDRLANEGMRFTNAYAACPVCSPTRASIQSGQYPARVGVIDFIPGHWRPYEKVIVPQNRTQYLPSDIITIGEAMIEHLDRSVGRILGTLDNLGLSKNTIVIFFSDNGGLNKRFDRIPLLDDSKLSIYENDSLQYIATSNKPLRGEKGTLLEGGIREPMIVKWPSHIKAGSVSNAIIISVDFFPTLVEIAGGKLPENQKFDGRSIVPVLKGKVGDKNRAIFWHYPVYHHAEPASAVRMDDWKLIQNLVTMNYELYNLKDDIGEVSNLAASNPGKVKELSMLLDKWRKDTGARLPVPNPDFNETKRYEWGTFPRTNFY